MCDFKGIIKIHGSHTLRLCLKSGMQLHARLPFVSMTSLEEKICNINTQIIRIMLENKVLKYINCLYSRIVLFWLKKKVLRIDTQPSEGTETEHLAL